MQSHMRKQKNKAVITILWEKSTSITLSKYKDTYSFSVKICPQKY
jgi:hypothetical protein